MTPALSLVAVASAYWILIHLGLAASPLRGRIIGVIGQQGFLGLFSILSAVDLGGLIWTYGRAMQADEFYGLRVIDPWMLWVPFIVMPFALILLVGSLTQPNPTLVWGEAQLKTAEPASGIVRVTRHPMLWAFALWAVAHLIANGDAASLMLFGSILVVAVNGMHSIDRKRRASDPADWQRFAAVTSIVPFGAIAAGRNKFVFAEIGWWRVVLGLGLWLGALLLHPILIGVAAIPF